MQIVGDARRVALKELIDYAGLFPPAALAMTAALTGYRAARSGPTGWLAGRFLCPTSRLEELASALTSTMAVGEPPWPVGAIFDEDLGPGASHAATFHAYADPAASVRSAEMRLPAAASSGDVVAAARAAASIDTETAVFLEVKLTQSWEEEIPAVVENIAAASQLGADGPAQ